MVDNSNEPKKEQIDKRAYQLYLARGCEHGKDLDDWLEAEAALRLEIVTRDLPASDLKPTPELPRAARKRFRRSATV